MTSERTHVEPAVPVRPHALPEGTDVAPESSASSLAKVQSPFSPQEGDLVSPLTLVLVRHGVTEMTETRRMSGGGVPGPSLSPAGRVQAAKAADAVYGMGRRSWLQLPHITRVIASPIVRTQETAASIGRRVGAHVETDDRLREVVFGAWEGLTVPEIVERDGELLHSWRRSEVSAPEGEAISDVGARGLSLVEDLAAEHAEACLAGRDVPRGIALVSHAVAIKSILGSLLAMPSSHWGSIWPTPASQSVVQVRARRDGTIAETHVFAVGIPVD